MSFIANRIIGWRQLEALQSTLAAVILFVATLLFYREIREGVNIEKYAMCGFLIAVASGVYALINANSRKEPLGLAMRHDISAALGQTLCVSFVLFAYFAAAKDQAISRIFVFTYLPALFVVLLFSRKWSAKFLGPLIFEQRHRCGTIVVGGTPAKADQIAAWIESKSNFGLQSLGWVSIQPVPVENRIETPSMPMLGTLRELQQILNKSRASVVLVADLLNSKVDLGWLRAVCDRSGARLAFSVDFGDTLPCGITTFQEDGINLVALREEPLESPSNRLLKRALDIAVSLPIVLLVLPVLAVVVRLIHLLQSPGPLIFRQVRTGLHGKPFTIYKFRTMHVQNDDETRQAVAGDKRVFSAGAWLRKLSLDEFPQFLNVLQGSMSIVGPRPHLPAHDDRFATLSGPYRVRTFIKPGITGLAQVSGFRGPTATADDVIGRTKSDLFYLENWSLRMDAAIILRTFLQFSHSKGAV